MTPPHARPARVEPVRPQPLAGDLFGSLRMPVFWLLVGLLIVGAARLGGMVAPPFARYPLATTVAFALFALYAVPFVLFITHLDRLEREPPVLLATAFAWGAVVVTVTAVPGNLAAESIVAKLVSPRFAALWGPALAGPTVEETLKFLGVVVIALLATSQINSVVDGMVYGAMVGLGYQVMENVSYAAGAVQEAGTGDRLEPVFTTFVVRGILGGPWSHTVFTALAGAGVGYAVVRVDRSTRVRAAVAGACLGGAWLCHFAWNSPLLAGGFGLGAPGRFAALLVKGAPVLALVLALAWLARRREDGYYAAVLSALGDPWIVTPAELRAMCSLGGRAALRRAAYARAGAAGDRAARRLQEAQARLAVELSRGIAGVSGPGGIAGVSGPGGIAGVSGPGGSVDDAALTPTAIDCACEVLRARHALAAVALATPDSRRPFAGSVVMWLIGAWVTAGSALGLALMLRALS